MSEILKINLKIIDNPIIVSSLTSLVIQNVQLFAKIVQEISNYSEESEEIKIFDHNYTSLKDTELVVISDIIGFELNSASIIQIVHKDLEKQIFSDEDKRSHMENIINELSHLVELELIHFTLDLENSNFSLVDLFKLMKVKIATDIDSIFDKVMEIIRICKYLPKKRLLILVNAGTFLTQDQLIEIEEYVELHNYTVLLIYRHEFSGVVNQYIIDDDFVVMKMEK